MAAMMHDGSVASSLGDRRLRIGGGVVSVVLVLATVALAIVGAGGDAGAEQSIAPQLVEVADLTGLEAELGHSIYWAGERSRQRLELTEEGEGSVYLRYLPPGVGAGDPRQRFLTVGTYPVVDAVRALARTAAKEGGALTNVAGDTVLVNPTSPGSVYLAKPGSDLQIEVYDPAPGRSLRLIRSGVIRPVG
jgi:hypothetical protein